MKMLQVHGWGEWQSYRKDRGLPPWIKVQRNLQRNLKWIGMSDAERGQLLSIWLLAVEYNGKIPACAATIMKLCYMTEPPNLERFISSGWLDNEVKSRKTKANRDNQLTTTCQPTSANLTPQISDTDTDTDTEEEEENTPPENGGGVIVIHETRLEKPKPKPNNCEEIRLLMPDWLPSEVWDNYRAHRHAVRNKHGPWSNRVEKIALKKLTELRSQGFDVVEIIEQSILNGWAGFFPVRNGSGNGTGNNKPTLSRAEERFHRIAANTARASATVAGRDIPGRVGSTAGRLSAGDSGAGAESGTAVVEADTE